MDYAVYPKAEVTIDLDADEVELYDSGIRPIAGALDPALSEGAESARALSHFGEHSIGWLVVSLLGAVLLPGRRRDWLVAGAGTRRKLVRVTGVTLEEARRRLRL